jgi:hypothetical protein
MSIESIGTGRILPTSWVGAGSATDRDAAPRETPAAPADGRVVISAKGEALSRSSMRRKAVPPVQKDQPTEVAAPGATAPRMSVKRLNGPFAQLPASSDPSLRPSVAAEPPAGRITRTPIDVVGDTDE